jgi:hypothetical protein
MATPIERYQEHEPQPWIYKDIEFASKTEAAIFEFFNSTEGFIVAYVDDGRG